jgi:hypothetical protein
VAILPIYSRRTDAQLRLPLRLPAAPRWARSPRSRRPAWRDICSVAPPSSGSWARCQFPRTPSLAETVGSGAPRRPTKAPASPVRELCWFAWPARSVLRRVPGAAPSAPISSSLACEGISPIAPLLCTVLPLGRGDSRGVPRRVPGARRGGGVRAQGEPAPRALQGRPGGSGGDRMNDVAPSAWPTVACSRRRSAPARSRAAARS